MEDPFGSGESTKKKSDGVADAVNRLIQNLVIKCAKEEGIRDYFHIAVLGYGAETGPAFGGTLSGRNLVPISKIGDEPMRIEERVKKIDDGAGGLLEQSVRFPIWLESVANGGTPMCRAFRLAADILQTWLVDNPDCFPPIVINVTDGESTDGDPTSAADVIKGMSSSDGNVLLFNLHCSSQRGPTIEFPDNESALPDKYAKLLFGISSLLPPHIRDAAREEGYVVSDGTRGFVFNGGIEAVVKFLDLGTRASNLR
jgi:hypothetical protein